MKTEPDARSQEDARLEALRRYAVLDTVPEAAYDRVVRLAARFFRVPMALISFVDAERQWFKARIGIDLAETPRAIAFCNRTIEGREICLVPDAALDPRFADNPLVLGQPHIRFYAGVPLVTPDGHALGSLCVLDTEPRADFSPEDHHALAELAAIVVDELELRCALAGLRREARRSELRGRLLEATAGAGGFKAATDGAMAAVREATGALVCLLFRLAPDGRRLQIVGGQGRGGIVDEAYLARLREIGMTIENSASGQAIRSERQLVFEHFHPGLLDRYPGMRLNAEHGGRAQIVTPVLSGDDKYAMALSFGAEVTDLRVARDMLAEAASTMRPLLRRLRDLEETELFRRAAEASDDGVVIGITDHAEGQGPTIRYVNEAFLRMTGYAREEIIGQRTSILAPPDPQPDFDDRIQEELLAGRMVHREARNRRRDGSIFWAEISIAPLFDQTGWFTHWVAIRRDITARRAEAQALAESEASFRHFFEQHPAPMWVYDKETLRFLEVNRTVVAEYGWSRDELLRMSVLDIRPEEDREAARAFMVGERAGFSESGPWRHRTKSGEIRLVQIRSQVTEHHGRPAGIVAVWNLTERMEAEKAARELAADLRATFESIDDGFYTLDRDWRFAYANATAQKLLRPEGPELVGQLIWELWPDLVESELGERFRRVARTRETERFAFRYPAYDAWYMVAAYPSRGGITVWFRDVSVEHRRNERLRVLEAAVANLNDIIMITEAEPIRGEGPRIVYVNPAFERITGYRAEEVIGRTPRVLQGPGTSRPDLDRVVAALEAWKPVRAELLNYRKDGGEFWLDMDIAPVADAKGWYTQWVAVERDVTERRRAQEQLEQQAQMLAQARDAILVRGLDQRILYWNRSAERIYGWAREEVLGRDAAELFYAETAAFEAAHAQLMEDGFWNGRIEQRRKDGARLVIEGNWTLLRHEDGRPRAILAVNADVTERVALEGRLRQAQRMEAVGQLTGGIAHDFNNLLTVILGNAEMLADSLGEGPQADPALRSMAEVVAAAAERGAALTGRLLAFSRRQALDPKTVDLNQLLASLVQMLRRTLGGEVELAIMAAPGLWSALIDPPQLENAVLNLCLNARDAMPGGGRLVIETENVTLDGTYALAEEMAPGEYVTVAVTDTGTGMTPEIAAQAFEPFFTTKEVGAGSGLGLSMVYGFVKQSNGHVKIYSEVGHGTSVKMYIPRARQAGLRSAPPPEAERLPGGTEHILLAEDDPLVRAHAVRQLRELGYRVTVASGGAEALAALPPPGEVDLLFTDVVMPGGMNGQELAREVTRLRPGLPVLFTSGYTENAIMQQGRLAPGVMLLQKPYRRRELAEKIRQALDSRAS
ncbi:PAS domain S-box protein [Roseococcus sp. SYP-B2431]|uniref:PAS domain S-box protein n=1 Tax=Roseococcus sp. SYP-B2431 TaxID=2496640 RepID=UPI00103A4FFB|nr:PAS domain S-box protein [Roseococcus sp. SYP-B2431]TCH99766.1 PAS domain S-box protein [Roseococcus sp. SYP-B2431]